MVWGERTQMVLPHDVTRLLRPLTLICLIPQQATYCAQVRKNIYSQCKGFAQWLA